ncbi:unnamed protein product [Ectocarpus sp. 12 AP-2014]
MAHPTLLSWTWLSSCALLVIPIARETSGWPIRPTCCSATSRPLFTCGLCRGVQLGPPPARRSALARVRPRRSMGYVVTLDATGDSGSGEGAAQGGGGGGGGKAAAPAPVPQHLKQQKEKQQRVQAAEDSDAPILYIKGLKEGGGVGLWGSADDDDDDDDDNPSPSRGGGNAAMMARALRNAEREIEGGGDYEEGVEEEGEGGGNQEAAVNQMPVWEKVQAALGLGVWSYVGLGLAVFIIVLNNVLGVGWATKIINPEYEPDSVLEVQQQGRQIQYMPLDDASNLLSD